jgi:BirA family biotin operon repressor/biotin-[acetyl-CoA-carboxylase] ligase
MSNFQPKILRFDSLPSTNTEAARQAQQGAAEGLCIVAREQTAGRGRLQRQWISPAGAGLYFSIVLRPRVDTARWSLLPLMAAVAVHDALVESCALKTDIKWPNDILFGEKKLCGILAETVETESGRAVVAGIGINLTAAAFPPDVHEVATSVATATSSEPDADVVLASLVRALEQRYETFQSAGGPAAIVREWVNRSTYATGRKVRVANGTESFEGVTRGLEPDGALRVETDAGEIRIVRAGDVTSVRPRPIISSESTCLSASE